MINRAHHQQYNNSMSNIALSFSVLIIALLTGCDSTEQTIQIPQEIKSVEEKVNNSLFHQCGDHLLIYDWGAIYALRDTTISNIQYGYTLDSETEKEVNEINGYTGVYGLFFIEIIGKKKLIYARFDARNGSGNGEWKNENKHTNFRQNTLRYEVNNGRTNISEYSQLSGITTSKHLGDGFKYTLSRLPESFKKACTTIKNQL